ncbi:hypothetical protein [Longimycelium tulufanense]|nr:hypothetical protein [Longimycelium tulufanense]
MTNTDGRLGFDLMYQRGPNTDDQMARLAKDIGADLISIAS